MGRRAGLTDRELTELPNWPASDAFDDREKLVLAYADEMTNTPVEVPDDLFARLRASFSEPEIVELTAGLAWENYRARFAHALGIESGGFSEGAFCPLPERNR